MALTSRVSLVFLLNAVLMCQKAVHRDTSPLVPQTNSSVPEETSTGFSEVREATVKGGVSRGDPCENDGDCDSNTGFVCLLDSSYTNKGHCGCPTASPVYIHSNSGISCVPGKKISEACLVSSQCEASNPLLKCSQGICRCPPPHIINLKHTCVPSSGYGRSVFILSSIFIALAFSAAGVIRCIINATSSHKTNITQSESRLLESSTESDSRFPRHRLRHPMYPPNPAQQRMLFSKSKVKRKKIPHADTIVSDNVLATFCCKTPPEASRRRFLSCHQFMSRVPPGARGENASVQCLTDVSGSGSHEGDLGGATDDSCGNISEGSPRSPFKLSSRLFRAVIARPKTSPSPREQQTTEPVDEQGPTHGEICSSPDVYQPLNGHPKREESLILEVIPIGDLDCMSVLSIELSQSLSDLPAVHSTASGRDTANQPSAGDLHVMEETTFTGVDEHASGRVCNSPRLASTSALQGIRSTASRHTISCPTAESPRLPNSDSPDLLPAEPQTGSAVSKRVNSSVGSATGAVSTTPPQGSISTSQQDEDFPSPPDRPMSVSSMVSKLKRRSPSAVEGSCEDSTQLSRTTCQLTGCSTPTFVVREEKASSADLSTERYGDIIPMSQLESEQAPVEGSGNASYGFSIEASTATPNPSCLECAVFQPDTNVANVSAPPLVAPIYDHLRGRLSVSRSSFGGDRHAEIRRQISTCLQGDLADALVSAGMCPSGFPEQSTRVGVLSMSVVMEHTVRQTSFQSYEEGMWSNLHTVFRSTSPTSDTVWISYTGSNGAPKDDDNGSAP